MESSLIKQDNNKKYWIVIVILILAVGIYLAVTNIDFSKIHINLNKQNQAEQYESTNNGMNVTSGARVEMTTYIGDNLNGLMILIVAITVFGVIFTVVANSLRGAGEL